MLWERRSFDSQRISNPEHAQAYLAKPFDSAPQRRRGGAVVVHHRRRRILDLGTGDGRLLALLHAHCPDAALIGVDFSVTMLDAAGRFAGDERVSILEHDLNYPLPAIGPLDAVVSSFAIHHCPDERKRSLYAEIYDLLTPGGVFCNLEHVASPTPALHARFLDELGADEADEDRSNILLDVFTQLDWLRAIGFDDVDCYWKWLELALFGGVCASPGIGH
ncbi:MAG: class I SAM-dependent methyltransferase [Caldilineales bacterium]